MISETVRMRRRASKFFITRRQELGGRFSKFDAKKCKEKMSAETLQ